jgi:hypothetical protein
MPLAIDEIERLVLAQYPEARFEVDFDEESGATWVTILADFDPENWDDVVDIYIDRLLEVQDDQGLWLHFMPISTRELATRSAAA